MIKKSLKTLGLCCLFMTIGIIIGSSSKTLLNGMFRNVNSSPEKVIESYLNAYYEADIEIMEKCLSPDLNDMEMLEYFGSRGSSLARDLINDYNEYLYYTNNPPEESEDELYQWFKNIENYGIVKAHVEEKKRSMEEFDEVLTESIGKGLKGTKVDIKFLEIESSINEDPSYIEIGIFVTSDIEGEKMAGDKEVVLQKKNGKYYIVDI